ncbi:hypothetical protein LTR94_035044, partial [Friedmanniomyces endolithicus]
MWDAMFSKCAARATLSADGRLEVANAMSDIGTGTYTVMTQVAADSYTITAEGTLDRRPLKLETPAVLRREGEGWRLAPTRFSFAGGTATVGGAFGATASDLTLDVARMPLAVLDIGYPGL